jgi:glycerol-3-phosphate dehydrogenase (NAD(P)+)
MALALADVLAFRQVRTTIWSPFPEAALSLERTRRSLRLPEFELPDAVLVTADPAVAFADATLAVNAIPTQFIRSAWSRIRDGLGGDARGGDALGRLPIVSVAKGIETERFRRPTEILAEVRERPGRPSTDGGLAVLSGPTIAAELARRLPAVLVAASSDPELARRVQATFASPWMRIYTNDDVLGVELAGALKNVIAIAAGIIDGLGLGSNAKSALLARGLAEMARFGTALGARTETFFGVAGVGDLATTCFSPEGRNRSFGEALARGETSGGDAGTSFGGGAATSVVEGAPTAKAVVAWARTLGVSMPIAEAVHGLVFEGLAPAAALADLMRRAAGAERIG